MTLKIVLYLNWNLISRNISSSYHHLFQFWCIHLKHWFKSIVLTFQVTGNTGEFKMILNKRHKYREKWSFSSLRPFEFAMHPKAFRLFNRFEAHIRCNYVYYSRLVTGITKWKMANQMYFCIRMKFDLVCSKINIKNCEPKLNCL